MGFGVVLGGADVSLALFDGCVEGVAGGFDAAIGRADAVVSRGVLGSTAASVPLSGLSFVPPVGSVTTWAEQPAVTASTAPAASTTRSVAVRGRRGPVHARAPGRVDVLDKSVLLSATELSEWRVFVSRGRSGVHLMRPSGTPSGCPEKVFFE